MGHPESCVKERTPKRLMIATTVQSTKDTVRKKVVLKMTQQGITIFT